VQDVNEEPLLAATERYVRKDFRGSSHRILARWVRELRAGTRIVELGVAAGHLAAIVDRRDLEWLALEADPGHIGELHRRFSGAAIIDVQGLTRLPRGHDVMIMADVLDHLINPEHILHMAHDALPPGGRLLVSVPNVAHLYVRLVLLFGRFPYAERGILDRTHRVFFTRRSTRELLARCGFAIERETVSTVPLPLAFPRWPRWLLEASGWLLEVVTNVFPKLLGFQFVISARRV
jgi:2-polyprenyl-3-methyl-5-hydroxy-6-metoxy-1,4-benzoquinol methylase